MGLTETTRIKYTPSEMIIQRKKAKIRAIEWYLSIKAGMNKSEIPLGDWSAYQSAKELWILEEIINESL